MRKATRKEVAIETWEKEEQQKEFWDGYELWAQEMDAKSFAQDLHEAWEERI